MYRKFALEAERNFPPGLHTYMYIHAHAHVGLKVVEVAHDFQQQIRRCIIEELGLLNSYDPWHGEALHNLHSNTCNIYTCIIHVDVLCFGAGTKNVVKGLAKVIKGRKNDPIIVFTHECARFYVSVI